MAQRNIDFGTFPDDPSADAIRTAFEKTQENFDQVFTQLESAAVSSINKTPGAGITVNQPTGNVVITANIACVQVSTSTLSIGRDANGGNTALITTSSQVLVLDLPDTISNVTNIELDGNANVAGNIIGNNITANSNISATGNISANNVNVTSNVVAGRFISNVSTGTSPIVVSSSTKVANLNADWVDGFDASQSILANTIAVRDGDGNLHANSFIGNLVGSFANGNSNVSIPAANGNVNISAAGNANILLVTGTGANIAGTLSVSGNANAGNVTATTAVLTTGNISTINSGLMQNGNSAITINANSNISFTASGNTSLIVTDTGVDITGTLNVSSNLSAANSALGNTANANFLTVNNNANVVGDLLAGNIYANAGVIQGQYLKGDGSNITNISVAAGSYIVNGNSNVFILVDSNVSFTVSGNNIANFTGTGVNVNGTLSASGNISGANGSLGNLVTANFLTGTLTTGAQPNITSVGTLASLTVNGISNLGPNSNLIITGGSANTFLMTDGNGNLQWSSGTLLPAQGSNTQIIYNDNGVYAGSANFTFNKTTNALSVTGNITGANVSGGNLVSANFVSGTLITGAQPNITSVGTITTPLIVQNNLNAGTTVVSAGTVTANTHALTVLQTWNNSAVQFSAIEANITDTASNANSLLFDLQVSSNSKFSVNKNGNVYFSGALTLGANAGISIGGNTGTRGQTLKSDGNGNAIWSTQYYYGNTPPNFSDLNYGDIFFYIDTPNNFQRLYMWVTDGSSDYFYDFLPPSF